MANKKICVVCGCEFPCAPSRNTVTCSPACRAEYTRKNHTGLKHSEAAKDKMRKTRLANARNAEIQAAATEAAKKSPKSGRSRENIHAIDWHLVDPEGRHYEFRSLYDWLRENGKELFGVEPDSRQYYNTISGLSRAKKSVLGTLPPGQRPNYTHKGWSVIPTDSDIRKSKIRKNCDA